MKLPYKTLLQIICIALIVPILAGWGGKRTSSSVQQFDTAVQQCTETLKAYFSQVNDLERIHYLNVHRFDAGQTVAIADYSKKPTALVTRYDPKLIEGRILVLSLVGGYTRGLASLASNDAPETAESNMKNIGASIESLNSQFVAIAGTKDYNQLDKYAGPLSALWGMARSYWIRRDRDKAVLEYISNGAGLVDKIFDSLDEDLEDLYSNSYKQYVLEDLLGDIKLYNKNFTSAAGDPALAGSAARIEQLDKIGIEADRYSKVESLNPRPALSRMKKVHADLVACIKSGTKKPEDYAGILADLNSMLQEADKIGSALQELRK